jgi:flagellar hook-associated protein 2
MANTSISGLVSGLDSASIINQLIQLEAQPQTMLKSRMSAQQSVVKALQALNTKLAGIATSAGDLAKTANWSPVTASSSNAKVTVTAASGAVPSTLSLTVDKVATPSVLDFGTHALADKVLSDGSKMVSFTKPDGTTVPLDTGDGTVQGLANAIISGSYGATATLVQVSAGTYRLQITSATTGAKTMTLAPPSGSTATMAVSSTFAAGKQAQITVGPDVIKSDSNTFTGLMTGVDVTLTTGADAAGANTATITIGRDAQGMSDKVKALVDAVNSVLTDIGTQTGYDAATKKSGPLAGESMLRDLRGQLLSAVTNGVGGKSLVDVGIQTDRYGKLVFDETKFKAAYAADPSGAAAKFVDGTTPGFAQTVAKITQTASNSTDGTLTGAINGMNSAIGRMEDDIADWDVRLEQRRTMLQRQYGALEVALGKMQNQASWLAGQISSLPKMMGS